MAWAREPRFSLVPCGASSRPPSGAVGSPEQTAGPWVALSQNGPKGGPSGLGATVVVHDCRLQKRGRRGITDANHCADAASFPRCAPNRIGGNTARLGLGRSDLI